MSTFAYLLSVYEGSDGEATKALYDSLRQLGPAGLVALDLFRAQKASARAKVYRGGERGRGSYRSMAYEKKGWALDNLCKVLAAHANTLGIAWGWGEDAQQPVHRHVLYVETPVGQVSFHSAWRGDGPNFPGVWDGARGTAPARICRWATELLGGSAT